MKATCQSDESHNRFITVAHISQDWVVDEEGNFQEHLLDLEVVAKPNSGNTWTCEICGADATVTH